MFINIGINYLALISIIQKNKNDEITNFIKVVLQIIRYFGFIKENKKVYKIMKISSFIITTNYTFKSSYTKQKYIKKG